MNMHEPKASTTMNLSYPADSDRDSTEQQQQDHDPQHVQQIDLDRPALKNAHPPSRPLRQCERRPQPTPSAALRLRVSSCRGPDRTRLRRSMIATTTIAATVTVSMIVARAFTAGVIPNRTAE